jgi:glutathione S-transferase
MIVVHHLDQSRSQRILWLLEELQVPYEIAFYHRDVHGMSPEALRCVHPLGKSPIVTDGDRTIAESGAIIEYIQRHYGNGRLRPATDDDAYDDYVYWLHYAEGSAVTPFVIAPIAMSFGKTATPLRRRVDFELDLNLSFINSRLEGKAYLLGEFLTAADIQMSFVGELAAANLDLTLYPNIEPWVNRFQSRSSYRAAVERGGYYKFQR